MPIFLSDTGNTFYLLVYRQLLHESDKHLPSKICKTRQSFPKMFDLEKYWTDSTYIYTDYCQYKWIQENIKHCTVFYQNFLKWYFGTWCQHCCYSQSIFELQKYRPLLPCNYHKLAFSILANFSWPQLTLASFKRD